MRSRKAAPESKAPARARKPAVESKAAPRVRKPAAESKAAPRARKPAAESKAPARARKPAEARATDARAPKGRAAAPAAKAPGRSRGAGATAKAPSRRAGDAAPARSRATPAKPRAARPDSVAAKPMRGAARAPSRSAAPHLVPARPMPEAKVIRRPVGVPPKPVPQEEPNPRKRQVIAGPEAKPARRSRAKEKATPDRLDQLVAAARASLEDDKAEDILVLDVTDRASFTDRMIIGTGLSERQIQAMANHLEDALEKVGLKLRRDAIQGSEDWVLIDCGDLVIHLFKPEARMTYALERMWGPESPPGGSVAEDGAALPEEPDEA